MSVRGPGHNPNTLVNSNLLKAVDITAVTLAVASLGLSANPDLRPIVEKSLDLINQGIGTYFIMRGFLGLRDKVEQKSTDIINGEASIKRKEEQLVVFGGDGHPALDILFNQNPSHTIPVLNNRGAAESLIDSFTQRNKSIKGPFYCSLGLEEEKGTTAITTPALENINLRVRNLLKTDSGLVLLTVGFNGSLVSSLMHNTTDKNLSLENNVVLHRRLLDQIEEISRDQKPDSVMIRISDSFRMLSQENYGRFGVGNIVERQLLENSPEDIVYDDRNFERNFIWIDAFTPILEVLKKRSNNSKGLAVGLKTSIPGLKRLPFLEEFGLKNDNDKDRVKTIGEDRIVVVLEDNDVKTLASLNQNAAVNNKDSYAPIFNSQAAALIAQDWGFKNAISVAEVYEDLLNAPEGVLARIKQGKKLNAIQKELDERFHYKECLDKVMKENKVK